MGIEGMKKVRGGGRGREGVRESGRLCGKADSENVEVEKRNNERK